jgi:hypothetical protein
MSEKELLEKLDEVTRDRDRLRAQVNRFADRILAYEQRERIWDDAFTAMKALDGRLISGSLDGGPSASEPMSASGTGISSCTSPSGSSALATPHEARRSLGGAWADRGIGPVIGRRVV